jgi:cytochrome c oxidase subunit II
VTSIAHAATAASAVVASNHWGSPAGVTTQDKNVQELWNLTFYFAIPLGLIVIGLIIFCIIRYRKRPADHPLGQRKPSQIQYHIPLEVAYTVIPIVIVAIVFGFMYGAEDRIDYVAKNPPVQIKVEGFQWGWRFTYITVQGNQANQHPDFQITGSVGNEPNLNDQSYLPTMVLPVGQTVQFNLYTDDVNHSFYIPATLFKRDLIKGVANRVDMNFTRTGTFGGECTQFCGTYHPYMRFNVQVEPVGQFLSWVASKKPNSISYAGVPVGAGVSPAAFSGGHT